MTHREFRLPLSTRLMSMAFAAVMSLAMLAGVDALATGEPNLSLLARAPVCAKA